MGKKFFSPTGRISDIIGMATKHDAVFSIERIMDDYEIGRSAAYETLRTLRTIDYITVHVDKDRIIIALKT